LHYMQDHGGNMMSRLGRVFVSFIAISITLFSLTGFSQAGRVSPAGAAAVKQPDLLSGAAADPLDEWWWRNPLPSGNFYPAVTYGNGMFVAVNGGFLLTSSDGITWIETASGPALGAFWDVAYGNGIFVAVGGKFNYWKSDEIGTPVLYVSHNGITWTAADVPLSRGSLCSVAYGDGKFVAVGTGRSIIVSSDGSSWTVARANSKLDLILNTGLFDIVYGNGLFVAAGFGRDGGSLSIGYGGGSILTSPDGMTWTERAKPDTGGFSAVTYGNGTFVAASGSRMFSTSPDGITWIERMGPDTFMGRITSVTYGNGLFVAAGEGILTSPDGVDWTPQTLPFTNETARVDAVTFCNGLFVAVGTAYDAGYVQRPVLLTSQDGVNWTERSSSITREHFQTVEYGNGTFMAMSSVGSIFTSPNGATWTKSASSLDSVFQSLTYGGSKFVGVGFTGDYHGSAPVISTSTDGVDWSKKSLPVTDGALNSIVYGNGTFVTAGYYWKYGPNSTYTVVSTILTSTDGDVWSPASLPDGIANGRLISVAYGNGLFVASGFDSDRLALFTSSDGITWTPHKSHSTTSEMYIWAYGNNLFVATEYFWLDPTGRSRTVILTSPDGLSWTKRYTLPDNVEIKSLRYGNGVFVAVGEGNLLSSSDGIRWTKRSAPTPYSVRSLAYGNKTFVVVGSAGNIIQSSRLGNVLTVAREGGGSGKVMSAPAGITCGTTCSATFIEHAVITLTAVPDADSVFTGWAGDCTGSGPCAVSMNGDIAITATFAALPALRAAPGSLNFGKVKNGGTSAAKTVTVKNTGAAGSLLAVAAPAISGPNSAEFSTASACSAPLAKGESCLISVAFSPKSEGTSMSANLTITTDAKKGTTVVKLKGASGPANILATPHSVTFPPVQVAPTTVPSKTITIKNTGVSDLIVSSAALRDGSDTSFGATNDCATLAAGSTCRVTVTFNPLSSGKKTGSIDMVSNSSKQVTVQVTGTAK
jgi:hypothetical protein